MQFIHNFRNLAKKPMAVYVLAFLTLLVVVSFFSLGNLIMAYKNGDKINNQTNGEDKLESDFVANIFGKDVFLNLNGGIRYFLGQREMNDVVMLNNGYLAEVNELTDVEILKENVENMAELQQALARKSIPSLYVLAPAKIKVDSAQLPHEIQDYTNQSMDTLVEELNAAGVETLDLRKVFPSDDQEFYSLFFRTDHHWNVHGGFLAYQAIAEKIESMLNIKVDERLLSEESFTEKIYPSWYLGSYGKRTGVLFAGGRDDFSLLLPNFSTDIINNNTDERGNFEKVLLNLSSFEKKGDEDEYDYYDQVFPLGNYHSTNTGCGKKILFVCDSMGRTVLPYLVLAFGDVRYVYDNPPEELTTKVLDAYKPDIVVVMHYAPVALTEEGFDFPTIY